MQPAGSRFSLLSVLCHNELHSGATEAGGHPPISTASGPQGTLPCFPAQAEDRGAVEEQGVPGLFMVGIPVIYKF